MNNSVVASLNRLFTRLLRTLRRSWRMGAPKLLSCAQQQPRWIYLIITSLLITLILRWHPHSHPVTAGTMRYAVTQQALRQPLYFSGIIQPLRETALICPIDASVKTMHYNYGQWVNQDETIFTLNSSELEKQYNDTLTDYLKAKDNFGMAKARFTGTQELWKTGLISKNSYLSEKSSLNTARIALMQSNQKLTDMLRKIEGAPNQQTQLSALNLAQFNQVKKALNQHHNLIRLKASIPGILLYPPKSSEDKTTRITIGSTVKTGQVMALIGDITGIHVEIDIPETDINKIHVGMVAYVTGTALGKHRLQGKIIRVNTQATPDNSGGAPFFGATVEVSNLSAQEQAAIKIGMSAAIELIYEQNKQLMIPIKAIKQQAGKRVVTILKRDGSHETREVVTGLATAEQVVIEQGLSGGELIIYDT